MGRAFVFTATAFLLVIPAIILAASFSAMTKVGDAGSVTAIKADKVYYIAMGVESDWANAANDIVTVYGYDNASIENYMQNVWMPDIENTTFTRFAVNMSIAKGQFSTSRTNVSGILYVNLTSVPFNITSMGGDVYLSGSLDTLLIKIGSGGLVGYDVNPPGAPTQFSPTCDFSPKQNIPVNLSWNVVVDPESGTLQYRLQISSSSKTDSFGNFVQNIVFDAYTSSVSYPVGSSEGINTNSKYYWHVKVEDNAGNWGVWSSTCKFNTK